MVQHEQALFDVCSTAGANATAMLDFQRLKTPPRHGDVLIEPSIHSMVSLAEGNRSRLDTAEFNVLDMRVQELRSMIRGEYCKDSDGPIVVIGHQPEFIHPGVWAKHIVATRVAFMLGTRPINLIVDSDAPQIANLDIPVATDGRVEVCSIAMARTIQEVAVEGGAIMDAGTQSHIEAEIRRVMGDGHDASCMPIYLQALGEPPPGGDIVDQLVKARRAVDRLFGIDLNELRISRVWFGPFLAELIHSAHAFATAYNGALGNYRAQHRIRGANRPIPDLAIDGSRVELPVWVYRVGQPRQRLFAEYQKGCVTLLANRVPIARIATADLRTWNQAAAALQDVAGYLFRPRALTLTMWARLLLGDLFIHGIGGAKYDRITDDIIRRYCGFEPPAMACASATLFMDLPYHAADDPELRAAEAELRDTRHNPHRHVRRLDPVFPLLQERERMVAESHRLRQQSPRDHGARRAVFESIRTINDRLNDVDPKPRQDVSTRIADLKKRLHHTRIARHRDYFFALHRRDVLEMLRDKLAPSAPFRV